MNLLDLANRLKTESGRSGSAIGSVGTATGDDAVIVSKVQDAWRNLQMEPYNWRWMRKTTVAALQPSTCVNTPTQLLASDCERWAPEADYYKPTAYAQSNAANEWELIWAPYERFRKSFLVGSPTAGAPQYWSISPANEFLVGPPPDASTYNLRTDYFKAPVELTNDTDEPDMPSRFHLLVMWLGLKSLSGSDASANLKQEAYEQADSLMSRLVDSQGEKIQISAQPIARGRRQPSQTWPYTL